MNFLRFAAFSVSGGILWVVSLSMAGYYFGQIPFVKRRFEVVIIAIIFISVLPALFQAWKARKESKARRFQVTGSATDKH